MAKINIYFEDLNEGAQEALREALQEEMMATGAVDPHSGSAVGEVVDDMINRGNFANEFTIAEGY
jgi:hypothetical protein